MERKIFDAEKLNDLLAPLNLGWKARAKVESALMTDLIPLLKRKAKEKKYQDCRRMKNKDMEKENEIRR